MYLQNTLNEVHRKIGENLLTIQRIEYLLKFIVTNAQFSASLDQFVEVKEELKKKHSNKSMGQVLSHFFELLDPDIENNELKDNQKGKVHISYDIDYNFSKKQFEKIKTTLSTLLKERNDLVHHFIDDFDENSTDSCIDNIKKLDQQKIRLSNALTDIQSMYNIIVRVNIDALKLLKKELHYNTLRNEKTLLLELAQLSLQNHRLNGWVSLGFAGKHLRNIMPEEVKKLKDKYGYKTLKPLIQNTKIFEIKEDTNKNMIFYRITADWKQYLKEVHSEYDVKRVT